LVGVGHEWTVVGIRARVGGGAEGGFIKGAIAITVREAADTIANKSRIANTRTVGGPGVSTVQLGILATGVILPATEAPAGLASSGAAVIIIIK